VNCKGKTRSSSFQEKEEFDFQASEESRSTSSEEIRVWQKVQYSKKLEGARIGEGTS